MDPSRFDLTNAERLRIGFGEHDFFQVRMRGVRLYRRALGGREIARLADSGASP